MMVSWNEGYREVWLDHYNINLKKGKRFDILQVLQLFSRSNEFFKENCFIIL